MNLGQKALQELFADRNESRELFVTYSARFADYNANVKYTAQSMTFSLSKAFLGVSEEIRQGIIEHLLCKVYREHRPSTNQDLYHSFMKHMTKYARVEEKDPYLLVRFQAINERYFSGMMTEPNLRWGKTAVRKLGHYEYSSDTIVISSIFSAAPDDEAVQALVDYVLYHEMLHKKHQYNHRVRGSHHHTKAFKADEAHWHEKDVEKKLKWFLGKKRLKKALGF